MANCFREISEFDDAARNGSARGSSEGKDVNESPFTPPSISARHRPASCRKMNIKDTFDCFPSFFCLVSLNFNGLCGGVFVTYSMVGKRL